MDYFSSKQPLEVFSSMATNHLFQTKASSFLPLIGNKSPDFIVIKSRILIQIKLTPSTPYYPLLTG